MDRVETTKEALRIERKIFKAEAILVTLHERRAELLRALVGKVETR